jgi:hypothetical protein
MSLELKRGAIDSRLFAPSLAAGMGGDERRGAMLVVYIEKFHGVDLSLSCFCVT